MCFHWDGYEMTETKETEDTLFHALGTLEDLFRKMEEKEDKHLKWVSGLGTSLTLCLSSILMSLWDPSVLPVLIFGGPIFLMMAGICFFGARKAKKKLKWDRSLVGEMAHYIWKAEDDVEYLMSPILKAMYMIRLTRIGEKKDFPSSFSSY